MLSGESGKADIVGFLIIEQSSFIEKVLESFVNKNGVCKRQPPPPPPGPVYLSNKMQLGGCSKLHRNISPLTSDVTDSCKAVVIT